MDQTLKKQWIEALRSGEYKQTKKVLCSTVGGFCCLGVLADKAGAVWKDVDADCKLCELVGETRYAELPTSILPHYVQADLIAMNDEAEKSFAEIADWIELNL